MMQEIVFAKLVDMIHGATGLLFWCFSIAFAVKELRTDKKGYFKSLVDCIHVAFLVTLISAFLWSCIRYIWIIIR